MQRKTGQYCWGGGIRGIIEVLAGISESFGARTMGGRLAASRSRFKASLAECLSPNFPVRIGNRNKLLTSLIPQSDRKQHDVHSREFPSVAFSSDLTVAPCTPISVCLIYEHSHPKHEPLSECILHVVTAFRRDNAIPPRCPHPRTQKALHRPYRKSAICRTT